MCASISVFGVHRDAELRESIRQVAAEFGYEPKLYDDLSRFRDEVTEPDHIVGCVVAEIQNEQTYEGWRQIVSEANTVSMVYAMAVHAPKLAVRAMREGAADVILNPGDVAELRRGLRNGLEVSHAAAQVHVQRQSAKERFCRLTEGETSALALIIKGLPNKQIALRLDVGLRTVERRRHAIYSKVGVDSAVELAKVYRNAFPVDE